MHIYNDELVIELGIILTTKITKSCILFY